MIPFNKPYITGKETDYINEAVALGRLSAGGIFTKKCEHFLEERFGFARCFLTTSCTSALEMAAMIYEFKAGDEIIIPSYTFVSTASSFARAGMTVRFADSLPDHPNIDCSRLEEIITPRTKAIIPVHYGGVSCDMPAIKNLAAKYNLHIIEDAAHSINTPLGHTGEMSCFSFHETKNIHCGEGGMLAINDPSLIERAENIWYKGTNRTAFERGEIPRYEWVLKGSAFAPSEISAAFLYAQLEAIDDIQYKRNFLWKKYYEYLLPLARKGLFLLPEEIGNSHIFYLICHSGNERNKLIKHLSLKGILAVFHYQSLHRSLYGSRFHDGRQLPNAGHFSNCLVRLPLFYELTETGIEYITGSITQFYS